MRSIGAALRGRGPSNLARPALTPYAGRALNLANLGDSSMERSLSVMGALGTMFAIVNRTSTATAKVKWRLYEKAKSGLDADRVENTTHDAVKWIKRPNPFTSWQPFAEGFQQHVDLVGESYWMVVRSAGDRGLPLEMWYLRPDRVEPVPDVEKFLSGYVYRSPTGERVPLEVGNIIPLKMPNPMDPYRGMSPVPALMAVLGNTDAAIRWNESFFRNSAEPGGIIQLDVRLGDEEFNELRDRWREQHQGTDQAHRVAILERGQFIERKITQRDMEFVNGLSINREMIREAYGMPKFLLGGDEGSINRATADAAMVVMGEFLTVPRADRVKDALNTGILPMYGPEVEDRLEYDYDSPVPGDQAADNAKLAARVNAAKVLIEAGADPTEVFEYLELPAFTFKKPAPSPAPVIAPPAPAPEPDQADPSQGDGADAPAPEPANWYGTLVRPRLAADPSSVVDLEKTRQAWDAEFARLGDRWQGIVDSQVRAILTAVRAALDSGDLASLAEFGLPDDVLGDASSLLDSHMISLSTTAAGLVVGEARAQGRDIQAGAPDHGVLSSVAMVAAGILASQLILGARRELMRAAHPGADPRELANVVRSAITATPAGGALPMLAGALSRAQSEGRYATLAAAPLATYYATERYDTNTCGPCAKINGKHLPTLDAAMTAYGGGPYLYCEGRWRCRGTYVAVWPESGS